MTGWDGTAKLKQVQKGEIEIALSGKTLEPTRIIKDFAALSAMDNNVLLVSLAFPVEFE